MLKIVGKIDLNKIDQREKAVIKKRAEAKKAESNKRLLAAQKTILEIKKKNESRLKKAKTQLERNAIKNSIASTKDKLQNLRSKLK